MEDTGGRGMGWLALEAFDPAPIAVALTIGPEHRLVYSNLALRTFIVDRPLGEPAGDAFGDRFQRDYGALFDTVLATGEPVNVVETPVNPGAADGQERVFSFNLSRFTHERPGVLVIAVDVTEQVAATRRADRSAEQERRWRRRFESLVWLAAQVVWVADPAGRVIDSSGIWERVTGQRRVDYTGQGWSDALHPDDRPAVLRSWKRAVRQARPWHHTYRVRTQDGQYRHFELHAAPVKENGAVVEWIGTATDVERQWQERQRRELLDRAAAAAAARTEPTEIFAALADVL
ncbi:PAS domain-containing protein, partial [Spirillospora sp. NPDC047418]